MPILPSQPVSMAKILDISIKLYTASMGKLIGLNLIMTAIYFVFELVSDQISGGLSATPDDMASINQSIALSVGVFLVYYLVTCVVYIAVAYRIVNVANQREDSFIEALQMCLKKLSAALVAGVSFIIIFMIGFVLLIVPSIIIFVSMMCYPYFIVVDSLDGFSALKASHKLVWGHWWRTATVFMVPTAILQVFSIALTALSGYLELSGGAGLAMSLINSLLVAFTAPLLVALGFVQYHDLKLRKSGADLELRLGMPKVNLEK